MHADLHCLYELREYAEVLRKAPANFVETDEGFRYVAQQAKSMVEELDSQAVSLSLLAALRLLDALVFRDAALDPESASNTPLFAMLRPAGATAALAQFYSALPGAAALDAAAGPKCPPDEKALTELEERLSYLYSIDCFTVFVAGLSVCYSLLSDVA